MKSFPASAKPNRRATCRSRAKRDQSGSEIAEIVGTTSKKRDDLLLSGWNNNPE